MQKSVTLLSTVLLSNFLLFSGCSNVDDEPIDHPFDKENIDMPSMTDDKYMQDTQEDNKTQDPMGDVNDTMPPPPQAGEVGYQTINSDGSITYIDYLRATRTAPASAAAAEYHTGLGYGNTLFDSADNKCQNCHNELYDTWKGSMHGKSWSDPIFQSKFQDFLRTHIAKIGQDKTAATGVDGITGIVYTEKKFKGVAQTCIKCHAPGAYYAGDFKVTLTALKVGSVTTTDLQNAQEHNQSNLATPTSTYNATLPASVVAVSESNDTLYQATYQIGHRANIEGINCAFCHSMETPRLMAADGADGGQYTLKDHLRVGPHGPAKAAAGSVLNYDTNASSADMNKFFRLWGPEKYVNYAHTPKTANCDLNKSKDGDGRYTMTSKDLNGLSPNETERYTLNYDISGKSGVKVTYKVYYMQKGANGKFLTAADGFLDKAKSDAKKLLVTEVYSQTISVE